MKTVKDDDVNLVLVIITGGTITMEYTPDGLKPEKGLILRECRKSSQLNDDVYLKEYCQKHKIPIGNSYCALPQLPKTGNKRIIYKIYEWEKIVDSCDMDMEKYKAVCKDISDNYNSFDSFVITHGTDTMAYTASYLSFMLKNLSKLVILTGSQLPIIANRSDAVDNLGGALYLAGTYPNKIPEVTLFFNYKLFRGNRSTKVNSDSFAGFDSPNLRPLAVLYDKITINWDIILNPPSPDAKLSVRSFDNSSTFVLFLFPGITGAYVENFIKTKTTGIVLQSFGAGNAPNTPDFLTAIRKATSNGIFILNTTQCLAGGTNADYETGKDLYKAGVIFGSDITPEAALAKLGYVIAFLPKDDIKKYLELNLRGEITKKTSNTVKKTTTPAKKTTAAATKTTATTKSTTSSTKTATPVKKTTTPVKKTTTTATKTATPAKKTTTATKK